MQVENTENFAKGFPVKVLFKGGLNSQAKVRGGNTIPLNFSPREGIIH